MGMVAVATLITWSAHLSRRNRLELERRIGCLESAMRAERRREAYATGYLDGLAKAAPTAGDRALHPVN
jgi:type II secretory pathway pseudopilin PulG